MVRSMKFDKTGEVCAYWNMHISEAFRFEL